jgi:uncharacterized protein (DUF2252 family)
LAELQINVDRLNQDVAQKDNLIAEQTAVIETLKQSNQNLSNEIAVLAEKLSSTEAERLLQEATTAQKAEEDAKLARQQIRSINQVELADQTKSKKQAFFTQAVKQLRSNIPGVNLVTSGVSGIGGINGIG